MKNYFSNCKTAEDVKRTYYKLAKQYHADNGGDDTIMAQINAQYTSAWNRLKDVHTNTKTGETFENTGDKRTHETPEQFINIVSKLAQFGFEIELVGTWLWIHGDTYNYRNELKSLGCRWSKSKKRWYWTTDPYTRVRKTYNMSTIRMMYGSEMLDTDKYRHQQITG